MRIQTLDMPGSADTLLAVGRDTMTQRHSSHRESGPQEQQQQADVTEEEPITLETLDAETGLGPTLDDEPGEIYLDPEDFIASLPPNEGTQ